LGAEITFKRPDGGDAKGYLTNSARGDAPGVVVIQEWWGLAEQIKALVDRFALAGFDALAPDLFNGVVVPYHDAERASKEMMSLNFLDATEQTVRGAVQYLKRNGAKVGIAGFCMGGAVAIIGAAKIPELTAAVSRTSARAGRQSRGRQDSASGSLRQQGRSHNARRSRCFRKGAEGCEQGCRVLPL
jgi:carboxymethylenebutenolidase